MISDISLEVDRGELVLLAGPSGSGKTTLLALLGGMLLPTSGEVFLDEVPLSRLRDPQRARLRREKVGYLFQDLALLSGMSVLANVMLPLVPDGLDDADEAKATALLTEMGIGDRAGALVDGLSGGERQRVALSRALVRSPALLLLDEPTAHLDSVLGAKLVDTLVALAASGRAVVIATHDPRLLEDPRMSRVVRVAGGALA